MAIHIPELLTSNSETFIGSIRLEPGGLSFSGYQPYVKGSFFYAEEKWDRRGSYIEWIKEFFFTHEWLTLTFQKLYVIEAQADFTIVPLAFYIEQNKDRLFPFVCGHHEDKVISSEWKDAKQVILYSMNKELYDFCLRSLNAPTFICSQIPLFKWWRNESLNKIFKQIHLSIDNGKLNIACFAQGSLLFSNYYHVKNLEDMLYYTLYIWKQFNWNAECDQVHICGDANLVNDFAAALRTYIRQVNILGIPSDIYLMGDDLLNAPIDIIALSINENN